MDFDTLALEARCSLCLEAEIACLARIREIKRRSDPADGALHQLLQELEDGERVRFREFSLGKDAEKTLSGREIEAWLDPYFPSLREHLGEAPLTRDTALYYVEVLKEEASRFFGKMAQAAVDEDVREVCTRLALGDIGEVTRLRTVLL